MKQPKKRKWVGDKQYFLEKTVNVSDPDLWYGEPTVTAVMKNLPNNTIRIIFLSIDDKMIYRDVEFTSFYSTWDWCKEWLWDKIPDTIDTAWLYEHGYMPF